MGFSDPADHNVTVKEDKYHDLARDLTKLCNMKVIVIPVIVRALGIVLKNLKKKLDELEIRRIIETKSLLKSARILRSVLET